MDAVGMVNTPVVPDVSDRQETVFGVFLASINKLMSEDEKNISADEAALLVASSIATGCNAHPKVGCGLTIKIFDTIVCSHCIYAVLKTLICDYSVADDGRKDFAREELKLFCKTLFNNFDSNASLPIVEEIEG
ncbi:MAG: hypothetical protein LBI34_00840 [Puniceicoccales bacterium]|jgi:hypothetical protein|nr:hypothetical protein [Puniceicoccales bacterium]